jgi:hypothetical protein
MSDFNLTATIEEFCSHAIYVEEDGRNKLQDLLFKTQKPITTLLMDLIASQEYELTSNFLKKVNRYAKEREIFLESQELGSVCSSIAAIERQQEVKINFVQLFISGTLVNAHSLRGIITPAISWIASDSLELSDLCCQVLSALAGADITIAEEVVTIVMQQVDSVKDDDTKYLRYLCLLSGLMKVSSEYFLLCEAKGASGIVISAVNHFTALPAAFLKHSHYLIHIVSVPIFVCISVNFLTFLCKPSLWTFWWIYQPLLLGPLTSSRIGRCTGWWPWEAELTEAHTSIPRWDRKWNHFSWHKLSAAPRKF